MRLLKSLLLFSLVMPLLVSAKIYQTQHTDGSISYSDTPGKHATPVEFSHSERGQSYHHKTETVKDEAHDIVTDEQNQAFNYQSIAVSTPTHEQTFWNQREISVVVNITPELRATDKINVLINDVPQSAQASTRFTLHSLTRGEHQIKAIVLDKHNKVLKTSEPVKIFIHLKSTANLSQKTKRFVQGILPSIFSHHS